jgi:protein-disulfide isomerase
MKLTHLFLAVAASAACLSAGPAAADPLTVDQKEEVRTIVREYLMENPEILVEALQAYQVEAERKQRERQQATLEKMKGGLDDDGVSPVMGNPDGDVTVVEFMDYRCGYCKKAFPAVQELLREDGKIRYVIKEFPILGPDSVTASKAALAVWRTVPDKYTAFHTALMESRGGLSQTKVLAIASDIGADAEAIREGMNDPKVAAMIDDNRQLAVSLGIRGTPAFIIDGTVIPGAIGIDDMRDLVAAARDG